MKRPVRIACCLIAYVTVAKLCNADPANFHVHWHQWRGPRASGHAPRANPPTSWDEKTNVQWKVPLPGLGSSTPIVWGDHVLVLTAVETKEPVPEERLKEIHQRNQKQRTRPPENLYRYVVIDIDRRDGSIRWQTTVIEDAPHEGRHQTNTFASASPITDGRHVYAFFGSRGLFCLDFAGRVIWSRDLGDMRTRRGWGEGASPALYNTTLLVNWDHEDHSFLTAMDAATGNELWRVPRDEVTSWSTPLVVTSDSSDDPVQVVVSATRRVSSYDVRNGRLLWECGGQTTNVVASPVTNGQAVFCMSSYGRSAIHALPLNQRGDLTGTDKIRWKYDRAGPYCPSPLLVDDKLYFVRSNSSVFGCLNAETGETIIAPRRLPGLEAGIYASPVAASDRIYFVGRDGVTAVLSADGRGTKLAVNRLNDEFDASAALVGRQMFLRGKRFLYCLRDQVVR